MATATGEPTLMGVDAFFGHVDGLMRVMADLLRAGHHADEVRDVIANTARKAKHCHQSTRPRGADT